MTDKTKKLFTQKELEHHIGARLMRERKKNTELMAFKGMLDEFISGGVFNADSYAEAGKRLMSFIAENYEAEEGESEAVNSAKDSLPTTENTQETDISEMADEPCDGISDGAEVSLGDDGVSSGEGVEETITGTLKSRDEHGVGDKISRLCTELISLLTSDKETEVKSADELFARRSASSTGFSQRSAGEGMVCADSLTPTQREIARRAGISYREYAGLLREIPENISKRRPYR
jgi:hypothetical protein